MLDALPFLDDADADGGWLIEDPEQALRVVETLPTLPAVAAVDWPQGKRLRVVRLDPRRLRVRVSRAGDMGLGKTLQALAVLLQRAGASDCAHFGLWQLAGRSATLRAQPQDAGRASTVKHATASERPCWPTPDRTTC